MKIHGLNFIGEDRPYKDLEDVISLYVVFYVLLFKSCVCGTLSFRSKVVDLAAIKNAFSSFFKIFILV